MTTTAPAFYQLSNHELQLLAKCKASGCTTLVYLTIAGFAYSARVSCWPSIDTIWKTLGKTISKRSIVRCMKTLEEIGLIKRKGSQRGKIRLLAKRASAFVDALVKSATSDHAGLQTSDQADLQRQRKKEQTKLSKRRFGSRYQRGRIQRAKHLEPQRGSNDEDKLEQIAGRFCVAFYEGISPSIEEVKVISDHKRRNTDSWIHFNTHFPKFVTWCEHQI